jgi:hypothetical protein
MSDELRRPETRLRVHQTGSWPTSVRAALSDLEQSLQSLRQLVLQRLDSLQSLARRPLSSAPAAGETAALARTLELKKTELAETERRLAALAEHQQTEWNASLTQLEADRRLLADAWERIERERIEHLAEADSQEHCQAHRQGSRSGGPAAGPTGLAAAPLRSGVFDSSQNRPLPHAIVRQFETLCSDVRRTSGERAQPR